MDDSNRKERRALRALPAALLPIEVAMALGLISHWAAFWIVACLAMFSIWLHNKIG